jgi:intermediate cleaving peptidase 55
MLQSVKPSFFRASSNLIDSHLKLGRFPSHRHFLNIIFKSTTPNNGKFEALGQPHPHSHPHLFKSKNDIIPGISRAEFELRRQLLVDQLPDDSLVAIPGNHEQPMTGSINFPFHQQADFYYLTGFMEPDSTLLLEIPKQATGERVSKKFNFALFVPPRDPNTEMWDGPITGVERVTTHFGAHVAHSSQELKTYLKNLRKFSNVFLPKSEGSISKIMPSITEIFERSRIKPLTPRLHEMRMTKSASEIGLMKSACSISALAHVATMKFAGNELKAKGHVLEQDLHAEFISSSMKLGFFFPTK